MFTPGLKDQADSGNHLDWLAGGMGLEKCALTSAEAGSFEGGGSDGFWLDPVGGQVVGPVHSFPQRMRLQRQVQEAPISPLVVIGETHLGTYDHVGGNVVEGHDYQLSSAGLLVDAPMSGVLRPDQVANLKLPVSRGGPGVVRISPETIAEQLSINYDRARDILDQAVSKIVENQDYQTALKLANANRKGKAYLVGSIVYRALIAVIYGEEEAVALGDFDFLAENLKWFSRVPRELYVEVSAPRYYGDPDPYKKRSPFAVQSFGRFIKKFEKDSFKVDLFTLRALPTVKRSREGMLFDYFLSMPLAIQMLAFDPETKEFIGLGGLPLGVASQASYVNNSHELARAANREGITEKAYRAAKTRGLGLRQV